MSEEGGGGAGPRVAEARGGAAQCGGVSVELGLATPGVYILSCTCHCASAWMNAVRSSGVINLRLGAGYLIGVGGVGTGFKAATGGGAGGQQRATSVL